MRSSNTTPNSSLMTRCGLSTNGAPQCWQIRPMPNNSAKGVPSQASLSPKYRHSFYVPLSHLIVWMIVHPGLATVGDYTHTC